MHTNPKHILVVGGAGYIGSHMVFMLQRAGYTPIVLDNLSTGHRDAVGDDVMFYEACMSDVDTLERIFTQHSIVAVMHFAAFIEVGESVLHPLKYYVNNVARSLVLFDAMLKHAVTKLVFSSTAAVYGSVNSNTINELHQANPLNPYGKSKRILEEIIADLANSSGLGFSILRYFNAAGAEPGGTLGERHACESHLIPLLLQVAAGLRESINIYGDDYLTPDGTCIRDYVHVNDICEAHLLALKRLLHDQSNMILNIGLGRGYSVLEVIAAVERVTGQKIKSTLSKPRLGDPAVLVADSGLIRQTLEWQPRYENIDEMIAHAWAYLQSHIPNKDAHLYVAG